MNRRHLLKTAALAALATAASSRWNVSMAQGKGSIFTLAYPTSLPDLDPATPFSNDGAIFYDHCTYRRSRCDSAFYLPGKF